MSDKIYKFCARKKWGQCDRENGTNFKVCLFHRESMRKWIRVKMKTLNPTKD